MLKTNYFMNKETGELITYKQAFKEFYSVPRKWNESIFDKYEETDIESEEYIEEPNFLNTINI